MPDDDHRAIGASLDELLAALDLRPVGDDRFVVEAAAPSTTGRVLGGRLLAQAVVGASATVDGKDIHSLHATFLGAGTPGAPVTVAVDRVRDGRSLVVRQVRLLEDDRLLLLATASFAAHHAEPDVGVAPPSLPAPAEVPSLQHWARGSSTGSSWITGPPAVEMRLPEAPSFFTGATAASPRSHWMRLPRSIGRDHAHNAALLAYASDFFLMDMLLRLHPEELGPGRANGLSLDHAVWFHRPVQFDRWHLYAQEAVTVVGDRGVARGTIHDIDGRCVATTAQEVLLRPGPPP